MYPQICVKSQWLWLRFSDFTKGMEGIIFAALEQALSTNAIKAHIYKISCCAKCHLCGTSDETFDHLVSSCSFLTQREYKSRQDYIALLVHYSFFKQAGFVVPVSWWRCSPPTVCETNTC